MKDIINNQNVSGEFVTLAGERYYAIRNCDKMDPFFITVISNSDHWLFVSSTGGLTAGRQSPATALFPYDTVDKIHDSSLHTGSKTLFNVATENGVCNWQPFNVEQNERYNLTRNLYKNVLGNKLCFEEINHDLQLQFRYTWQTSEQYGFVRKCEIENLSDRSIAVDVVDGLQNILPAGTPRFTQTNSSNLVDAYKWSELDKTSGLALFTLYSGITDRAEPCESLKANTVFCLGLDSYNVLLSSIQLNNFKLAKPLVEETHKRGIRGSFFINTQLELSAKQAQSWQLVANVEQSQSDAVQLRQQISDKTSISEAIEHSIDMGSDELARIMASGDAFQVTAEETVSVHHYANVQFNLLRGGAFSNQYQILTKDFSQTIELFNKTVFKRHQEFLTSLAKEINFSELMRLVVQQDDAQLERLCFEYLPIGFGRRHGDPSRPWNQFLINLKDENDEPLLTYQGNWRDIFQNWEALTFSYPEFIENVISKFVNASTIDGYNPYRVTKEGIDWEVEDENDPWSYIGYWGDHQIIYLQKMLELSQQFHPTKLAELLHKPIFSYANVPYRIKAFSALVENAKDTVEYDEDCAALIEQRVAEIGSDGKLLLDNTGKVYLVNLLEKLLVTLLCKLGNFVVDGGIWLNTQRPEWNDANNALVGQGLSMVTLSYLRRYISFLQGLLNGQADDVMLSTEVSEWLDETGSALHTIRQQLQSADLTDEQRFTNTQTLGEASCRYRQKIYQQQCFNGQTTKPVDTIKTLLENALFAIDKSIAANERPDGLYNAYNLLEFGQDSIEVNSLYPMLEGQVAVLSSGTLTAKQTISVVESLFASDVYREDQESFMLYPDRALPSFLEKNSLTTEQVKNNSLLQRMHDDANFSLVEQDSDGVFRFNAELTNEGDLSTRVDSLSKQYNLSSADKSEVLGLYETVFNHQEFTGRSGGMFGFEGLGCIYWHMVSKLLLAVEENYFLALESAEDEQTCQQLASLYYKVRAGIGFNKTPSEYGAFPTDPYSHTPKHAGAQQPGMTGQVKEEILARFGEFGIRVLAGQVTFSPYLLREVEFIQTAEQFRYLDIHSQWQTLLLQPNSLAFTWCQIPIVYVIDDNVKPTLTVTLDDGAQQDMSDLSLTKLYSSELFNKTGRVKQLTLIVNRELLLNI
ncbi:hypothetical protein AADZ86_13370 [Colwelliaceae bacterium BS250]